jgi:hypothetical protein
MNDFHRINSLLRDDGYLGEIAVRSNSIIMPIVLDLAGERLPVVVTFVGIKEFCFVGGLSHGAIEHPELVEEGINVFSTGVLHKSATEASLALSWEGERSLTVCAFGCRIEIDPDGRSEAK